MTCFPKLCGENKFVKSVRLLPLNIKSINPMQKYLYIINSWACILKIVVIFLLPINVLIFAERSSTPKLPKYVTLLSFT